MDWKCLVRHFPQSKAKPEKLRKCCGPVSGHTFGAYGPNVFGAPRVLWFVSPWIFGHVRGQSTFRSCLALGPKLPKLYGQSKLVTCRTFVMIFILLHLMYDWHDPMTTIRCTIVEIILPSGVEKGGFSLSGGVKWRSTTGIWLAQISGVYAIYAQEVDQWPQIDFHRFPSAISGFESTFQALHKKVGNTVASYARLGLPFRRQSLIMNWNNHLFFIYRTCFKNGLRRLENSGRWLCGHERK